MLPNKYADMYFPVGILLSSNRALQDAKCGLAELEQRLKSRSVLLPQWKVSWIGICAILRAEIHLLQQDAKSCMNNDLCQSLQNEWDVIKRNREEHLIYWEFINKERNSVLKEYKWGAYEAYFDENGQEYLSRYGSAAATLLTAKSTALRIREGYFKGADAQYILRSATDWVEARITNAVSASGFSIEDRVHFRTWAKQA